jgi:hypothetical protein
MSKRSIYNKTIGSTAHWTAAARALESVRGDHLFVDPWAAALAGENGIAWAEYRSIDSLAPIILRIRSIHGNGSKCKPSSVHPGSGLWMTRLDSWLRVVGKQLSLKPAHQMPIMAAGIFQLFQ